MSAEKVLEIARGELGYLEKASNSQLDSKTANAGSNNWTKYGQWYGVNGQPWCFEAGTLIHTPTGEVPIEDLSVGDSVIDADGSIQEVVDINSRLADNALGLKVCSVPEVITTSEHPFLVKRLITRSTNNGALYSEPQWVPAGDLQKHDRVALYIGEFGEESVPLAVAYLVGRYVGDGWTTTSTTHKRGKVYKHRMYGICCAYNECEDLEMAMRAAQVSFTKDSPPTKRTCQQYHIMTTNRKEDAVNNELFISIVQNAGHGALHKRIPDQVWSWNKECSQAFFDGFYAADGDHGPKKTKQYDFTTSSKELAFGLAIFLRRFGMNLNVRYTHRSKKKHLIEGRIVNINPEYQCNTTGHKSDFFDIDKFMWCGIRDIRPIDEPVLVYNLTVSNTHNFIANGLVVHNCDMFVSWCAAQAGESAAVGKACYCPTHVAFFKDQGRWYGRGTVPKPGDIIFFGDADHVGIVEACDGTTVTTIEGNTSGTSGLIANGGGVCRKYYPIGSGYIMGYGRPAYSSSSGGSSTMNGIDISAWQAGINIAAMTTTEFVIVKATQGTNYTNEYFKQHIDAALAAGKKIGAYHYANGSGAVAEADYFVSVVKPYVGNIVLALDWETGTDSSSKNAAWGDVTYAKQFLDRVKEKTGIAPLLYTSQNETDYRDWSSVANAGYKLWLAQYKTMDALNGYQASPWYDANGGAWGRHWVLHQYGLGYVTGGGNTLLDLDKFYGSAEDWDALAGKGKYTIGWNCDSQGRWWYADTANTYLANKWLEEDGKYYFFNSEGFMLHDTEVEYEGKVYSFDSKGVCTSRDIEEDEDMTEQKFYEMFSNAMKQYRKELQDNDAGDWSKADREWAISTGLFKGSDPLPDGSPNYMWEDLLTREQAAALMHRLSEMIGK